MRRVSRDKTRQKSETDYAGDRMEILFAEITVVSAPPFLELVEEIIRETAWCYKLPVPTAWTS
jgi:hypothetical protein